MAFHPGCPLACTLRLVLVVGPGAAVGPTRCPQQLELLESESFAGSTEGTERARRCRAVGPGVKFEQIGGCVASAEDSEDLGRSARAVAVGGSVTVPGRPGLISLSATGSEG